MKKSMTMMAAALCASAALAGGKPKALVVMLDGARADVVRNGATPNMKKLMAGEWQPGYGCVWSLDARTVRDAKPSSAANHTSIATGATPTKTGTFRNGLTKAGKYDEWPTFLTRIAKTVPGAKTAFAFSWGEDRFINPNNNVEFFHGSDVKSADWIEKKLAAPDGPDATLYFIDLPDHAGHAQGFYPYSPLYLADVHIADAYVGRALAAIASRPTFAQEDWLVIVTADHGGYARSHGIWGGHCTTIPYMAAAKGLPTGRAPFELRNYDAAAQTLAHFGIDPAALGIDGRPLPKDVKTAPCGAAAKAPAPAAFCKFARNKASSAVKGGLEPENDPAGFTTLKESDKLEYANGDNFSFAIWIKVGKQPAKDPALVSNKDWKRGVNPGIALVAGKATDGVKTPGICLNAVKTDGGRIDLGTYDIEYGKWTFYAASKTADGTLSFYQGTSDGRFYWMSETAAEGLKTATGLPWRVKQDGTGAYPAAADCEIREFGFWKEGLPRETVRRIFEAGRDGVSMDELF